MKPPALTLALAGLFALIFLSQGLTAPFEKDEESRPAGIIADIVHRGDWMLPRDVYGEVTRKPPLYYWLSAGLAKARGGVADEAGARVVSLIAAAMLAAIVVGFAGAHLGGSAGWLALLFLIGSYGFASRAAYARTDMLFTLFLFSAYCVLYPAVEGDGSPRNWVAGGLLLGLAVLTKGPLAIVLWALGILIYLLLAGRNPVRIASRPWPWMTLALAIVLASLWYVPAVVLTRGAIAGVQLMQENAGHLLPAGLGGTGEARRPFFYIVARFVGGSLPFSLYIPALFLMLRRLAAVRRPLLYQLALLIAVLGLFSLASAKRDDYILPAFAPFAVVLSGVFAQSEPINGGQGRPPHYASVWLRDLATAIAAVVMLLLVVTGGLLRSQASLMNRLNANLQSSDAAYLALLLNDLPHTREALMMLGIAVGCAASLLALVRNKPTAAAASIAIAALAGISLWIGILRPGLASRRTFKTFALQMRAATADAPVFTPGGPDYEVSYYYGRSIQPLPDDGRKPGQRYVLVWSDQLKSFAAAMRYRQVVMASDHALNGRRLLLLKVDANRFVPLRENN